MNLLKILLRKSSAANSALFLSNPTFTGTGTIVRILILSNILV